MLTNCHRVKDANFRCIISTIQMYLLTFVILIIQYIRYLLFDRIFFTQTHDFPTEKTTKIIPLFEVGYQLLVKQTHSLIVAFFTPKKPSQHLEIISRSSKVWTQHCLFGIKDLLLLPGKTMKWHVDGLHIFYVPSKRYYINPMTATDYFGWHVQLANVVRTSTTDPMIV